MGAVVTAVVTASIVASGSATRYDPHVMDAVVANRVMYGQVDPSLAHKGYLGLLDCEHLGRLVWLEQGGRIDGPYMVADCAADKDRARLVMLDFAVDLSWELAQDWNVIDGPVSGFRVWDGYPLRARRARGAR